MEDIIKQMSTVNPDNIKKLTASDLMADIQKADLMGEKTGDASLSVTKTPSSKGNGQTPDVKPIDGHVLKSSVDNIIKAMQAGNEADLQKAVDETREQINKGLIPSGIQTLIAHNTANRMSEGKKGVGTTLGALASGKKLEPALARKQGIMHQENLQRMKAGLGETPKSEAAPKKKGIGSAIGTVVGAARDEMMGGLNTGAEGLANKINPSRTMQRPPAGDAEKKSYNMKSMTEDELIEKGMKEAFAPVAAKIKAFTPKGKTAEQRLEAAHKKVGATPVTAQEHRPPLVAVPEIKQPSAKLRGEAIEKVESNKPTAKNIPEPSEKEKELEEPTAFRNIAPKPKTPVAKVTPLAERKAAAEEEIARPEREAKAKAEAEKTVNAQREHARVGAEAQEEEDKAAFALRDTAELRRKVAAAKAAKEAADRAAQEEAAKKAGKERYESQKANDLHANLMTEGKFKTEEKKPEPPKEKTPEEKEAANKAYNESKAKGLQAGVIGESKSDEKKQETPEEIAAKINYKKQEEDAKAQESKNSNGFSSMSASDLAAEIKINDIDDETASLLRSARGKSTNERTPDEKDAVNDFTKKHNAPSKQVEGVISSQSKKKETPPPSEPKSNKEETPTPEPEAKKTEPISEPATITEQQLEKLVEVKDRGETIDKKFQPAYDAAVASGKIGEIREKIKAKKAKAASPEPKVTETKAGGEPVRVTNKGAEEKAEMPNAPASPKSEKFDLVKNAIENAEDNEKRGLLNHLNTLILNEDGINDERTLDNKTQIGSRSKKYPQLHQKLVAYVASKSLVILKEIIQMINAGLTGGESVKKSMDNPKTTALLRVEKSIRLLQGYEPISNSLLLKAFGDREIPALLKDEMARPPLDWFNFAVRKSDVGTALKVWYGDVKIQKAFDDEDEAAEAEKYASFGEPKTDYVDKEGNKDEETTSSEEHSCEDKKKSGKEEKGLLGDVVEAPFKAAGSALGLNKSVDLAIKMLQKMNVDVSDMTLNELDFLGKSMIDTFDEVQKAVMVKPEEEKLIDTKEGNELSDPTKKIDSLTKKTKTNLDMKREEGGAGSGKKL